MHTMDTMHTFLEYMKKKYNDTKVEDTVRRKIYSQTNVYPSARAFLGRCAGVQGVQAKRFTPRRTNTRAGQVSRRKDPLPDKHLPSPSPSPFLEGAQVSRCPGVHGRWLAARCLVLVRACHSFGSLGIKFLGSL